MRSRLLSSALTLGSVLALGGCGYAANPLVGFGPFVAQTHTFSRADAQPPSSLETQRRAQGYDVTVEPLLPEPGNVWPGPVAPDKTLTDIEKEQNSEQQQIDRANPPPALPPNQRPPRGSSTPPGAVQTSPAPEAVPEPGIPPLALPPSISTAPAPLVTPSGPLIPTPGQAPGIGTGTSIGRGGVPGQSILVPNGNGTTTVIGPDGSTSVVPSAR